MTDLTEGYGILPNSILYNSDISSTAKLLYVCISSHCAEKGYCWATNKYLAEKMGVEPRHIQKLLNELSNYVFAVMEGANKRKLTLGGVSKMTWGGVKNDTHNNINEYTSNKLDVSPKSKEQADLFFQLAGELKLTRPPKFTQAHQSKLNARLKSFSPGELLQVSRTIGHSPYMMGQNPQNKKYATMEYLLRNDANIEKWLEGKSTVSVDQVASARDLQAPTPLFGDLN